MDNKHEEIFYNTDNYNNLSSSPTFLGPQINPASHQASSSDIFDRPFNDEKFDLAEMLSNRDYYFPTDTSIFEVTGAPSTVVQPSALQPQLEPFVPAPTLGVTSRIINTPETLDNSLICTKKREEPRFAFMMETDIDNMDDGYKWKKYGQKAVKNSPFPRNYYRCSSAGCGVKKRVERSPEFPSTVITTHEGTHNHVHPMNALRGSMGKHSKSYGFLGSSSNVGGGIDSSNLSTGSIGDDIVGGGGGKVHAKLSSGIGGNFSNGISVVGGGSSIGGKFSSPSCGIGGGIAGSFSGGASGGIIGSFGSSGSGSTSGNDDFFSLEMYDDLAMLRERAVLQGILAPRILQEGKKKDRE